MKKSRNVARQLAHPTDPPLRHRFLEAQDEAHTNYGKFALMQHGAAEHAYVSHLTRTPLLASLPPVRRFDGPITSTAVWLLDLQTQEGFLFDPAQDDASLRRRFLVHPLHVCILFFPVMRYLAAHRGEIWTLPPLVTLALDPVLDQPGVLLDRAGHQVHTRAEWSPRAPLIARLRNRAVPEGDDPEAGQDVLTVPEIAEAAEGTPASRIEW